MFTKIKRFLAPPVFDNDDEKNYTARILNVILLSFIVLIFVHTTIVVITRPSTDLNAVVQYGFCLFMVGLLYLMRRGYVRVASLSLISVGWVFVINLPNWLDGYGVKDTLYIANFVAIIAANLLVGWQASMVFALLTILVGWGFAYAENSGIISSNATLNYPMSVMMIDLTIVISLVTVLTTLNTTNLRKAIKQARNNERELTISNRELQTIRASLEERVIERTQRLQTVADMSGQLNAILDLERLLAELVRQVKEKFDFYHVHIYLLETSLPGESIPVSPPTSLQSPEGETIALTPPSEVSGEPIRGPVLRLVSGYGEAGAKMKAAGHFIPLEATTSLVARAGREREIVRVDDVHQNSEWLRNSLLPDTQAEMAVPIIAEDQVIGVLDVQSDRIAGLDDSDADLLRSLANQVAVTITNARLFEQVKQAKEEAEIAKQRAETASRAKSQFLSNMSHELRTPLNGILGYAQILDRGKDLTTLQRDGLNIIHQSGDHLLTLINDILDLSKIEAGKLDLYPGDFNLADCLNGVAGIIRIRTQQKGIAFDLEEATSLPAVLYADEKRLRQVLLNLLNNAVKFTDHGNVLMRVAVIDGDKKFAERVEPSTLLPNSQSPTSHPPSATLRFEVQDTGVGIAPEDMNKIFQPFEQVGEGQRKAEGTGLGLSITQRLLEMMDSELRVDSQLGRGSTFWFEVTLPLGQTQTYPAGTNAANQMQRVIGYEGQARKVLIVDDKQHNRAVMISILEPLGFIMTETDNGQDGIRLAQEQQPDLILMDMMMPGITGFEATQVIRQTPELKDTIIFGVSASVFEENRQQVIIAGCNAFVAKPVEIAKLLTLIKKHLKLEWVYEEKEEGEKLCMKDEERIITSDKPDIPPVAELQEIYTLARDGKIKRIREQVMLWKKQNPDFASFADEILKLTRDYKDEQIMTFLEPYLEEI